MSNKASLHDDSTALQNTLILKNLTFTVKLIQVTSNVVNSIQKMAYFLCFLLLLIVLLFFFGLGSEEPSSSGAFRLLFPFGITIGCTILPALNSISGTVFFLTTFEAFHSSVR
jgi:hypothetical protein